MRENLHRFFRAARGAGVHVSPAESIDAMRAVAQVGLTDRAILRDALLLTLAKSQDEKLALGDCFDLFFSQPEPRQDQPEPAWGGIPFLTAWKRKHRDRPKIVALCDVSGSVAQVSDFFLLLIHSLHEVVDDVRSFAFSSHLIEVSGILEKKSPEEAMAEIMSKVGFGSSDYGSSLVDFEKDFMSTLTPQTTVIVLGDARSNNLDPRADILRRVSERSKRLVWLNPEGRLAWGFGDSEMPRYATFCSVVRQCATAQQLERAVSDIVATYQ